MQGYTRRQLKEDKFVETAQGAAEWTSSHRQPLIYSGVAVLVIVLAAAGLWSWRNKQNDAANIALGSAMRVFTANIVPAGIPSGPETKDSFSSTAARGKAAEKEFAAIADKYSHTDAGHIARYLQGVAAMQAGENAVAEQQLKAVADSGDKNIAALAKMSLANYYGSSNRAADATRLYKDLEDHPTDTVSKVAAQMAMAELYESTDPQQASSLYQQILKENPNSPVAATINARLAAAKAGGAGSLSPE